MTTISPFNEEYTMQVLEQLWTKYVSVQNPSLKSINGGDIYRTLGKDIQEKGEYTWSSPQEGIFEFLADNGGFPRMTDAEFVKFKASGKEEKISILQKCFSAGTYFHLPCDENLKADKRIILNTTGNQPSFELMERLFTRVKNKIHTMKCYGKAMQEEAIELKTDKMIIYLPESNVNDVLPFCLPFSTYKKLPPFCDLMSEKREDNNDFYFGLAKERKGTSHLTRCTLRILTFLSNTEYENDMYEPDDLRYIIISMKLARQKYGEKCENFKQDCFQFVRKKL